MPTDLEQELKEQSRWTLRPQWEGHRASLERLVRNEFLSIDEQHASLDARVRHLLHYAGTAIPFYRAQLKEHGLSVTDIDSVEKLRLLPIVTKRDIQDRSRELCPAALPSGHRLHGIKSTSGSTGQPTRVPHTVSSILAQSASSQRDARWCRFDPEATFAYIRMPADLQQGYQQKPRDEDGGYVLSRWTLLGNLFHTGPAVALSALEPLEVQVRWLKRCNPDYLNSHASRLEHLALAFQEEQRWPRLLGIKSVAQQLTPAMRARVEHTFGVPVYQNYGFNEIGTAAIRCPEGGRYHVNSEHCVVEIVDEQGKACAPGQRGRILVTGFTNPAMPLIRYNPDDMAVAVEGPCPCGRTLPSFGEIVGRYGRTAVLPPETIGYWMTVEAALGVHAPRTLTRLLRQYQLHQFRDNRFELRLVLAGKPEPGLLDHIQAAWRQHGGPDGWSLTVQVVDEIPRPPGGKFQSFSSDFAPQPDPTSSSQCLPLAVPGTSTEETYVPNH